MTESVDILFGRGHLKVAVPAGAHATVIRKRKLPKLPDPAGAIRAALAAPVGAPPLADLARGKRSACILICDITRPVPNGLFLRPMIETMPLERAAEAYEKMMSGDARFRMVLTMST